MRSLSPHVRGVRFATFGVAALLLVGCQSVGERVLARAEREDTCGARSLRAFLGRNADDATRATMERRVRDARRIRWVAPGEDIPADLNTGRLNVVLDQNDTINGVGCY